MNKAKERHANHRPKQNSRADSVDRHRIRCRGHRGLLYVLFLIVATI